MRKALLVLLAGSLLAAAPARADTANVAIGEFFYKAKQVRIDPGDSVIWTNRGDVLHTVTTLRGAPQGFGSGNIDSGQTFTRAFTRPGTYNYLCTLHESQMSGVVQVGPDKTKPRITRLSAKAGKKVRVVFRVSEASRVVVRLTRRGRTVKTVRPKGAVNGAEAQTLAPPAGGRYGVSVTATDAAGNKSTARTTVTVR